MTYLLQRLCYILLLLIPLTASAQQDGFVKIKSGTVQYLDPSLNEWRPASDGERIPLDTYLIAAPGTDALLFRETVSVELPPASYFYVRDALPHTRIELVSGLTRIEATQLPSSVHPRHDQQRPVGLTYGTPAEQTDGRQEIPHREEREEAVNWFLERERADAALLSIKRMMTRFPSLYTEQDYVSQLLDLYDRLDLYGYLFDETERLLAAPADETFLRTVRTWNETAREQLKAPR